jgi:hypothetical protein
MKTKLWGLAVLGLISSKMAAQNTFEKGFYIDNNGNKIEGSIKNLDWYKNPSEFEFKTDDKASPKLLEIKNVKEFEIDNRIKYVRAEVNIDTSSDNINSLSDGKEPVFVKETVFLKSIVDGKYALYEYVGTNVKRFYYQTDNDIHPLLFKKYAISETQVAQNNTFIEQLNNLINTSSCNTVKSSDVSKIRYSEKDLKDIFMNINTCGSSEYKVFEKKNNSNFFHLTVRPGINFSSLEINNSQASLFNTDFGSKTNFRIGVEAEFVLPFNNNKWAFIAEPTYQYFNSEKEMTIESVSYKKSVKYSSVELPVGIRYYTYLSENSKLFFNASFIFDAVLNSSEVLYGQVDAKPRKVEINSTGNVGLGAGYYYKNKYSIEFNLHSKRNFHGDSIADEAVYKNFSIIFGYRLF